MGDSPMWRLGVDTARIAAGGVIVWRAQVATPIDLLFADTTNIEEASANPVAGFPLTGKGNMLSFGVIPLLEDWSNMKIIVSGNNAGIVTPNIYYNGGFVTPFQEYGASDGLWGYRPSYDADTSFSKGTKPFLYTFSGVSWRPATIATFGGSKMAGVKEIRVSFAGSKVEGEIASYVSWNGRKYSFSVYPFDPVKDYFQLRLGYGNVGLVSPKYDAPGTEHTVVFKLLTPAEWIKKIRYPNGMVTYYEQKWADEYFNTPNFTLYNASTRDKDLQTNGRWGNIFAPIVVTKVEYLF